MIPNDISVMLARVAERAAWQSVTAYETSALWVVELDEETEAAVEADIERGLFHVSLDVLAVAAITSPEVALKLLLKVNGETSVTGGLVFSLSPEEDRIALGTSFPLTASDDALIEGLPALATRAKAWSEVLSASAGHTPPAGDPGDFMMRV